MLVPALTTVTVAPITAEPELSVTEPVIVPRSDCPKTNGASSSVSNAAQSDFKLILVIRISKENILEGREEKRARRSQILVMLRVPRGWKGFEKSLKAACGVARFRYFRGLPRIAVVLFRVSAQLRAYPCNCLRAFLVARLRHELGRHGLNSSAVATFSHCW